MNIFRKIKASLRLKEAVRKAEEAHAETGERYYVIPAGSNKLVVLDRSNFRKLKFKGYMSRKLHVTNLEKECFYCTSYKNGKDKLPDHIVKMKRMQYYSWIEAMRKIKKAKKNRKGIKEIFRKIKKR